MILRLTIVFLLVSCVPVHAQELAGFDREFLKEPGMLSPAQQTTIQRMRELIAKEISGTASDEWAGEYALEDGPTSGAQLDWSSTNGFVVWWSTCSHGMRDQINFGSVTFRDKVLHVAPTLKDEGAKVYAMPVELIAVKWGDQHYLVPLDQLIAFCYAARNARRTPEINEFFLKRSDREQRRYGLPLVPEAYQKYLLGKPIQPTIVETSKTLTLNAGRAAGMVPGMKLYVSAPKLPRNVFMVFAVSSVTEHNSEAYVMISGFRNGATKEVKPKVGWRLTSRAPRDAYDYFP